MKRILLLLLLISLSASVQSQNTLGKEDAFLYFMKANSHKKGDKTNGGFGNVKRFTWFDVYIRTFMKYEFNQSINDEFKKQAFVQKANTQMDSRLRNISFDKTYTNTIKGWLGQYDFSKKGFPVKVQIENFKDVVKDAEDLFIGFNSIVNKDELPEFINIDSNKAQSIINSRKQANGKIDRTVYLKILYNVTKRKPKDKGSNGYKNTDLHIYVHKVDVYLDQYQNKLLGTIKPAIDWEDKINGIATLDGQVKLKNGEFTTVVNYENGKIVNPVKSYYANGQVRTIGTYNYLNAPDDYQIKDGTQVSWYYANGNLEQTAYFNDKNKWNGELVRYYKSGKVKEIIEYKNGYKNGCYKEYFEDGRCKFKYGYQRQSQLFNAYKNDKFDSSNTSCKCTPPKTSSPNVKPINSSSRSRANSKPSSSRRPLAWYHTDSPPVHNSCKSISDKKERDICTKNYIREFVENGIDYNKLKANNIKSGTRVSLMMDIDENGRFINIRSNAFPVVLDEVKRVLGDMKGLSPAQKDNNNVLVNFSFPLYIKY
ncbi:MAG: DUF4852 domain-containing protein [Candidatus Pacebacteria bacterium]|nr:DUF4852 domain-containing protein [Candidatus Paceibacterota bacterium]